MNKWLNSMTDDCLFLSFELIWRLISLNQILTVASSHHRQLNSIIMKTCLCLCPWGWWEFECLVETERLCGLRVFSCRLSSMWLSYDRAKQQRHLSRAHSSETQKISRLREPIDNSKPAQVTWQSSNQSNNQSEDFKIKWMVMDEWMDGWIDTCEKTDE